MRGKGQILSDALIATEKPITDVRSHVKLTILTLEVLIDIRDALITDCNDAVNALIEIRKMH